MRKILTLTALTAAVLAVSCNGNSNKENSDQEPVVPETPAVFAEGADISWATEMADDGIKFFNAAGEERECTALMQELGFDAVRYRVWVNPPEGWCAKEDVVAKAKVASDLGMRIMIDFHYSDWWADPQQQNKPDAWKDYSFEELCRAIQNHTREVLTALKDEGITPEWVQVGNETSDGMLWDTGKASTSGQASVSMSNYAVMTTAGYNAVKEIFPDAKVIVHLDHGDRPSLYEWIFDGLQSNGGKWDMIGMSIYPEYYAHESESEYQDGDYKTVTDATLSNIQELYSKYGTPVMICEAGMNWDKADECYDFLSDLITRAKALDNGACAGVFYWEPQCNPAWLSDIYEEKGWGSYTKGAFDENFRPTRALNAFKD